MPQADEPKEERMPVTIRHITEGDRVDWVRLRNALWPGSLSDHEAETRTYFEGSRGAHIIFVAEAGGRVVGFLELDARKYAPGCTSSPVPFIEGWYVEPALRKRGIGRALVEAAEERARAEGHFELASDAELENTDGIAAHRALGFKEVERVVCFRKPIP
jgi:aminoglycoside 6'-N-acetyltransferase I